MDNNLFIPQVLLCDEFKNLEFINDISQGWDTRWTYIKKGTTEAKLWVFTTPRIQFSWVGYNNAIMIESTPPLGSVQISFVQSSGVCTIHNKKVEKYELIIIDSAEEINYLASDNNEVFNLVFEKHFFHQIFYRYFGKELKELRVNYRLLLQDDGIETFILKMRYWLEYFQKEKSKELTLDVFFHIEEDIAQSLFSLVHTQEKRSLKKQFDIAKARKTLEDNIDNIYSIGDLVDELGINIRTLQHNFKERLGIAPKQYLQNLRLNSIRKELLLSDTKEMNISNIALKYGFFHPSHFTQEYKKLFGETPTQTLYK